MHDACRFVHDISRANASPLPEIVLTALATAIQRAAELFEEQGNTAMLQTVMSLLEQLQ